jgi:hypothetical protein
MVVPSCLYIPNEPSSVVEVLSQALADPTAGHLGKERVEGHHEARRLVGFAVEPVIKKFGPKSKDVVYSIPFGCSFVALKDAIELEVVRAIVHGKGLSSLMCAEHSNELLVRLQHFFLLLGG